MKKTLEETVIRGSKDGMRRKKVKLNVEREV